MDGLEELRLTDEEIEHQIYADATADSVRLCDVREATDAQLAKVLKGMHDYISPENFSYLGKEPGEAKGAFEMLRNIRIAIEQALADAGY